MRWILNSIYSLLLAALSPVIAWRMLRHGRYRQGLSEKFFGRVKVARDGRPAVWFHAVSVGEVIQLQKVVEEFRRQTRDRFQIVVSTSTDTGWDLAQKRFPGCQVTWFPLDFSWAARAAVRRIQPALVVLMELELWPNFLAECRRQSIPVSVVNARMSERSHRRYLRVRAVLRPMFRTLAMVASQSSTYAVRLTSLGVAPGRIRITGSIKFDGVETSRSNPRTSALRDLFEIAETELVLMAGSTQDPEESMAIEAWRELSHDWPNLRLILVPRHRERFDEVAELIKSAGLPLLRRSNYDGDAAFRGMGVKPVILLDTIGELSACWGLADVAFVGGSFGNRGGQNMIEPAAYGASVLFGPNTWNFRDVVEAFRNADACIQLQSPDQLVKVVRSLLEDDEYRNRLGVASRQFVQRQQGATALTASLLAEMLNGGEVTRNESFREAA